MRVDEMRVIENKQWRSEITSQGICAAAERSLANCRIKILKQYYKRFCFVEVYGAS